MPPIIEAAEREANYRASLAGERLPANMAGKVDAMVLRFAAYIYDAVDMEKAVSNYLVTQAVPLHLHVAYQGYTRDMTKLFRMMNNNPPAIEINALRNKWIEYGLDDVFTQAIIDTIINPP